MKFAAPGKGRYFCLESLNAHDGKPYAAIAELTLLDADGKPLSHEGWTIAYVDSEERVAKTARPRTRSTARPPTSGTPNGVPQNPIIRTAWSWTSAPRAW